MDGNADLQRQVLHLLVTMSTGDATEDQYAQLDDLIRSDPAAPACVVTALTHFADLEWDRRPSSSVAPAAFDQAVSELQTQPVVPIALRQSQRTEDVAGSSNRSTNVRQRLPFLWTQVAASFLIGVTVALWAVYQFAQLLPSRSPVPNVQVSSGQRAAIPVATLVSNTSFTWDAQTGIAMKAGTPLQAGKSVTLFEGVAEVQFDSGAFSRIQGPAIFSIDENGMPSLKYGKMITSNVGEEHFRLEVPMARILIPSSCYVGVYAYGDEVVVHAFEGRAMVISSIGNEKRMAVQAGDAVRLVKNARSELAMQDLPASASAFDFDMLMESDQISISQEYVDMIMEAGPLVYWRFEEYTDARHVRNEMGGRHHLRPLGDHVRLVHREGGGYAEFTMRETTGCLVSPDMLDELAGQDYSVEMWVKPSHFHRGALLSVFEHASDQRGNVERHGLLVEIHSANPVPDRREARPKAIRFLHRSPPNELPSGTSCFSPSAYQTQTWQHLAAVKQGSEMHMYINGKLIASGNDTSRLPAHLSLVVGQLFSFGTLRPFVGHLDEMAIYNRALAAEEVRCRVNVVRKVSPTDTW